MTNELKPCPFCGGESELNGGLYIDGTQFWYVSCDNCGCSQWGKVDRQMAIDAWNRRIDDDN